MWKLLAITLLVGSQASAHDWYSQYKQSNSNSSCCGENDCMEVPVTAVRYDRSKNTTVVILKPGEHKMLPEGGTKEFDGYPTPSPDGLTHVCIGGGHTILCVFQGGAS